MRFEKQFAILRDEKPSGTSGGSAVAATWNNRVVNTIRKDAHNIVLSLDPATGLFVLKKGKYFFRILSTYCSGTTANSQGVTRLFDVTNSIEVARGMNALSVGNASDADVSTPVVEGSYVSTGVEQLRIDTYTNVARASNGLGVATSIAGSNEVYINAYFERLDD